TRGRHAAFARPCHQSPIENRRARAMQYSPFDPWRKHTSPLFDPLSTTAAALSAAGTGISAANTIAGGNYAAQVGQMKHTEANHQAAQDVENAAGETAAAQRQAIDVNQRANLVRSSAVANAAANGLNAGTGSALTNQSEIVNKGQQNAWL